MDDLRFLKFEDENDFLEFVKYLRSESKEESIEDKLRHQKIVNTKKEILCLSMSQIRNIAKMILKANYIGFLSLSDDIIYEVCMIRGIVIVSLKNHDETIKYLNDWMKSIDSWSLCDSVISTLKWLNKLDNKKKYFDYFFNLCYNLEEYISRFGIVTLMIYYIEEEYLDKIFQMCNEVRGEKYYIQMAIAWLISVAFVKFRDRTYDFLQNQTLSKFTQNKAISKCRESFRVSKEDKEKLNLLKIK